MDDCTSVSTSPARISTIYALLDVDGNVRYVGITCRTLNERFAEHLLVARNGASTHCSRWIRSMGTPPTIVEIERTSDRLREIYWIAEYRARGYKLTNSTIGGDGVVGHKPSAESRAKMSASGRGKVISQSTRDKLSAANTGKVRSPETRARLSAAKSGKKVSEETRIAIVARLTGSKKTEETKAKIRAAHIGMGHTAETRAKLSATRKAMYATGVLVPPKIPCSQEKRQKISQSLKRRARQGITNDATQGTLGLSD